MIKKLLPLLLLILIGCSEPESEPVDINLLNYKLDGSSQYLNEPYSGPFFARVINEKKQLTDSYFLGTMVNGIRHGVIKKIKDGSDIPILENSYNNGQIVGPLIFYDSNGVGYPIDGLFDVVSMTVDDDTMYYKESKFRFFFDYRNKIVINYSKISEPDEILFESLRNVDSYGKEYNKWYMWLSERIFYTTEGFFTTEEPYFYSEYIRELSRNSTKWTTYSFKVIEPYTIELTVKYEYISSDDSIETYILIPVQDGSFVSSITEVDIPKNIEYFEELDSVFQKKSRILKESQDD